MRTTILDCLFLGEPKLIGMCTHRTNKSSRCHVSHSLRGASLSSGGDLNAANDGGSPVDGPDGGEPFGQPISSAAYVVPSSVIRER